MRPGWPASALAAALLATTAAATEAPVPEPGGLYALASARDGKCLDVAGADHADGAPVLLWDCLQLAHQAWTVEPVASGGFRLVAQHSGRCLSASAKDGRLEQRACRDGRPAQLWRYGETAAGTLRLLDGSGCLSPGEGGRPAMTPACGDGWTFAPVPLPVTRAFPPALPARAPLAWDIEASPLHHPGDGSIIVASTDATIAAHDPATGAIRWSVSLPRPEGRESYLWATPALVGDLLVAAYDSVGKDKSQRRQHVAVVDLRRRVVDEAFPYLSLEAQQPTADGTASVRFRPDTQMAHAALVHLPREGGAGRVYVGYGGRSDTQPWHGWLFEVDLDAWRRLGAGGAVTATLLTTPEPACPEEGRSGSRAMVCGGGIWSPAGVLTVPGPGGPELIVPTGNGQLDLGRRDYAQTLMRTGPGLAFDPGCDVNLCAAFDPLQADEACMRSCRNLFIPRLMPGDRPLRPASGECKGKGFLECLALHDYDLGASSPVRVELEGGPAVLVQPGKEGGLYLLDARHLGTLYDREQIAPLCGSDDDPCGMEWAGMAVTQPAVTVIDGRPAVLVATFVPDQTHPGGVVALAIGMRDGRPAFEFLWRSPPPGTREATRRFRYWPSRVTVAAGRAWVVDYSPGEPGTLLGIRLEDGTVASRTPLLGQGQRHTLPLVRGDLVYLASTALDGSGGWLEAYRIAPQPPKPFVLGKAP